MTLLREGEGLECAAIFFLLLRQCARTLELHTHGKWDYLIVTDVFH